MTEDRYTRNRCGIVLAGGDGLRLKPFICRLKGRNALPKQYVNVIGSRSMLEHTFDRAERLIFPERIFTVVSQDHVVYPEVQRQLSSRPSGTVIVQPENKGTGPGILLPLLYIHKRYPNSTVAVFPSDHFIVDEDLFMHYVDVACLVADGYPSRIVLLGIKPDRPEPEYGYIVPDGEIEALRPVGIHNIRLFVEKPDPALARGLVVGGGLWNVMVLAFRTDTLLGLVHRLAPGLYDCFQDILRAIGTCNERPVIEEIYRNLKPVNFSEVILQGLSLLRPSRMSVLPVSGVYWSDWGSRRRVMSALKKTGYLDRLQGSSTAGYSPLNRAS